MRTADFDPALAHANLQNAAVQPRFVLRAEVTNVAGRGVEHEPCGRRAGSGS